MFKKYRNFINRTYNYVIKKYNQKYAFTTKKQVYDLKLIIKEIIYFLKSGVSYSFYRGPINAKTLNRHILFFSKEKIFEKVYEQLYCQYLDNNSFSKLKYQSIDTSFVMNKNGKQKLGRNRFFKNKNAYKISFIVDTNKLPVSIDIDRANKDDAKIGLQNLDKIFTILKKMNNIKPYILGDKIYDTTEFRTECIKSGYKPIIDYNKRNTKNLKKIKHLTKKEKKIYKKRIKVENSFCILKKFKRIDRIFDSYFLTYVSFVHLGLCLMISNYL